jgi:hypothetical protein
MTQKKKLLLTSKFWKKLCPSLRVCECGDEALLSQMKIPQNTKLENRRRMQKEGYFHLDCSHTHRPRKHAAAYDLLIQCLAQAIEMLVQHGIPPTFVIIFDEVPSPSQYSLLQ